MCVITFYGSYRFIRNSKTKLVAARNNGLVLRVPIRKVQLQLMGFRYNMLAVERQGLNPRFI